MSFSKGDTILSAAEFNLDSFLDDTALDISNPFVRDESTGTGSVGNSHWCEPNYTGTIDYRIRQLSYSSLLQLHSCPRKFQLYKLRTTHKLEESLKSTITFAFGHVVGAAIQDVLCGLPKEQVIWRAFCGWHTDLMAVDEKAKKSFWTACLGIQRFIAMREAGLLKEYDLVYFNGKPAVELSFCIVLPNGFRLRGFVDAVLVHKTTGEVLVLECKTTGSTTLNAASYKNSSQAIGYSVVLDVLFPVVSSYKVLYLIYQTSNGEFTAMPFVKMYTQRAAWIQEIMLDVEFIEMCERHGTYPQRGESCFTFFRECEYINTCGLSTELLTKPCTEEEEDKTKYQINLTLADLIETQLAKVQTQESESELL